MKLIDRMASAIRPRSALPSRLLLHELHDYSIPGLTSKRGYILSNLASLKRRDENHLAIQLEGHRNRYKFDCTLQGTLRQLRHP